MLKAASSEGHDGRAKDLKVQSISPPAAAPDPADLVI
jgi:hypothetical protein